MMYQLLLTLIILLSIRTESRVLLSPTGDISVCPGSQPSFKCSTNNFSVLEWNVTVFEAGTMGQSINRRVLITSTQINSMRQLMISQHFFIFTRNSALNSNPLISTLTIPTILLNLRSVKVNCTDPGSLLVETSTSVATMSIINPHITDPEVPDVEMKVLENGMESISVLLEWSPERPGNITVYTVVTIPQSKNIAFIENTTVQLQLSYNTQYNVSIIATLCGYRNATTTLVLYFVKCTHPLHLPMIDDSVSVLLDNEPAVIETNATFSCLAGQTFSGPHRSTCMENGVWEPDPREVKCIANCGPPSPPPSGLIFPYISTIDGAVVNFICQASAHDLEEENITVAVCNNQGEWDPNPAEFCAVVSDNNILSQDAQIAIAVAFSEAVLIALLFFTIGLCCNRSRRKCQLIKNRKKRVVLRRPTPSPRCRETYYNMHPPSEQAKMAISRPIAVYDDVLIEQDSDKSRSETKPDDLPEKPKRPVVMYDDVLPPTEKNLKGENTEKPKVMYDEVIPPSEQEHVALKKNTAYRPADSK